MKKIKVLNLYAGLGGNVLKLDRSKYAVTSVEMESNIIEAYKLNNPHDTIIQGDAMEYLKKHRNEFNIIWASPPCQKHSRMMKATRHDVADYIDASLYQIIIFLKNFYTGKWVVENVKPYYEPLIKPSLKMGRHLFWTNFQIKPINIPNIKNFITAGTAAETDKLKDWLGIRYEGNIYYKKNHCPGQVLRNCVHPDLGEHIIKESQREGFFYF